MSYTAVVNMNFLTLPIFQLSVPFGTPSRNISLLCVSSLGHSVRRCMKVSGASSHSLHSGATGCPMRFWCLARKLCPVIALDSSWTYDRENSSRECEVLMLTVGKKNLVWIYCGSSCHLVFHSSLIILSTSALVSHHGLGTYLVMSCPSVSYTHLTLPTIYSV